MIVAAIPNTEKGAQGRLLYAARTEGVAFGVARLWFGDSGGDGGVKAEDIGGAERVDAELAAVGTGDDQVCRVVGGDKSGGGESGVTAMATLGPPPMENSSVSEAAAWVPEAAVIVE